MQLDDVDDVAFYEFSVTARCGHFLIGRIPLFKGIEETKHELEIMAQLLCGDCAKKEMS